MKLFKLLSVGLLFLSLIGCNEEGEFDSSRGSTNEAEAATTVAPVVQNNPIDISSLGEERVVSLKTSVADPQHLPVTLEQVVSLSKDCQDPTIIDPDGLTFSIDDSDPESCFYQYTVKNHTGDPALDKTAKGTTHTFLPAMKLIPAISEQTTIGQPLTIDLETELASEYPEGYVLDDDVVVFIGSGEAVADTSTNSITFTADEAGTNRLSYTLNDPNSTESEMGTIFVTVSDSSTSGPVAQDFMGPQNQQPGELLIVDVANYISDPDGDELNLENVDVDPLFATVELIDNPNGNNTQFSFVADTPAVYNVNYTVSDNNDGFASAIVTIVISARTSIPWGDISFNDVLVYTAPWEEDAAVDGNVAYTETKTELVDRTLQEIVVFDYNNALSICESYGMELPTEAQLLDLFNNFNSQGSNIQDADGNSWPESANYWSSESGVSVNLANGNVNDSESPDTPLMMTCVFPSLLQVSVTTDSANVLGNGETPESDNYNLVQANVFDSSGLPNEGETVFISSSEPYLTFNTVNDITDDNGEVIFSLASSVAGDFDVTVSYGEQNIIVPVTFLESDGVSFDISGPNEVVIGEDIQLTAETTDSEGNVVDFTSSATWSSDDENIASVNAGLVLGLSLGETIVSAEYAGVGNDEMTITVVDSFGDDGYIEVTPESVDLDTGDNNTQVFSATLYSTAYPDGKDITNDPATTWKVAVDDGVVGSLDENVFTAIAEGSATVEAQYEILETGEIESDTADVTVVTEVEPTPDSYVEVTPNTVTLDTGANNTQAFSAMLYTTDNEEGVDITTDPNTLWQVINGDGVVGSLDANVFTAIAEGSATVRAKYKIDDGEFVSDKAKITVTEPIVADYVEVTPNEVTLDTRTNNTQVFSAMLYNTANPEGVDITTDPNTQWQVINGDGVVGSLDENVFTAIAKGSATVRAKYKIDDGEFVSDKAKITVIEVTNYLEIEGENQVVIDDSITLDLILHYSVGEVELEDSAVEWSSSDENIATVDSGGLVTGIQEGTVTITGAFTDSALTPATHEVTVTSTPSGGYSMEITPESAALDVGDSQAFTVKLYSPENPDGVETTGVAWTLNEPNGDIGNLSGEDENVFTATNAGSGSITATWYPTPFDAVTATADITVAGDPVPSDYLEIEGENQVAIADSITLELILHYSVGEATLDDGAVEWSSSDESIATVDSEGVVTGIDEGTVIITGSFIDSGLEPATHQVTVTSEPWGGDYMEIIPESATLDVGDSQAFTAKIYSAQFPNGVEVTNVPWTLNEPNGDIGDLSGEDGNVFTATNGGSGSITATWYPNPFEAITATADITVTGDSAPTLTSVEITSPINNVKVGYTQQYEAVANYSDGSSANITSNATWTANPNTIAKFSYEGAEPGVVTGLKEGTATIKVTYSEGGVTKDDTRSLKVIITGGFFEIRNKPQSLAISDTANLTAWLVYNDGTSVNVTDETDWESVYPDGISVNNTNDKGLIEALDVMSTEGRIRATYGVYGHVVMVNVTESEAVALTSVEITNPIRTLNVDNTYQYEAVANYSDGSRVDITYDGDWRSSLNSIAKFSYEGAERGVLTSFEEGETTVSVTYEEDGVEKVARASLEITATPVTTPYFTIRDIPRSLAVGSTTNLTAWLVYGDGTSENVTDKTDWKSVTEKRISVNSTTDKGLIEALDGWAGTDGIINASYLDFSLSMEISIAEESTVASFEIREAPATLEIGSTDNLEAWVTYIDGTSRKVTNADWVTKNPNRISVNNTTDKGLIEALSAPGFSATIESTYGELKDSVSIELTD